MSRPSTTLTHVAPGADPAFQQAMDKLLTQVNVDNVLDVHRAFQEYADAMRAELQRLDTTTQVGLCGIDPVSVMAAGPKSFGGKVRELLQVHWQHCEELDNVASLLRATARSYGHSEDEITSSLASRATS